MVTNRQEVKVTVNCSIVVLRNHGSMDNIVDRLQCESYLGLLVQKSGSLIQNRKPLHAGESPLTHTVKAQNAGKSPLTHAVKAQNAGKSPLTRATKAQYVDKSPLTYVKVTRSSGKNPLMDVVKGASLFTQLNISTNVEVINKIKDVCIQKDKSKLFKEKH